MAYGIRSKGAALGGGLAMLVLAGCAEMQGTMRDVMGDTGLGSDAIALRCDDDRRMSVSFHDDNDRARVRTDADGSFNLELVERDDDRRIYEDEDGEARLIVEVGEEAHLRLDDGNDYDNCQRRR